MAPASVMAFLLFDENSRYLFHQVASDCLGRPCIAPVAPRRAGMRL